MRLLLCLVNVLSVVQLVTAGLKWPGKKNGDAARQESPPQAEPQELQLVAEALKVIQTVAESPLDLQSVAAALQKVQLTEEALQALQKGDISPEGIQSAKLALDIIREAEEVLKGFQTAIASPQGLRSSEEFKTALQLTKEAVNQLQKAAALPYKAKTAEEYQKATESAAEAIKELHAATSSVIEDLMKSYAAGSRPNKEVLMSLGETLVNMLRNNPGMIGFSSASLPLNKLMEHYEEKRKSVMKMKNTYNIAKDIWAGLDLKDKSDSERVKNVIEEISKKLWCFLPEYINMEPMEEITAPRFGVSKYFCGYKGVVRDFTKIKLIDTKVSGDEKGGFRVKLVFTIPDLQFVYKAYYANAMKKNHGKLLIDVKKNNLKLTLEVPPIAQIPPRLALQQCIAKVTEFDVSELEFKGSRFVPDSRKSWTDKALNAALGFDLGESKEKELIADFEERTLVSINNDLVDASAFICRDEAINAKLNSEGAFKKIHVFSSDFDQYCGKEYYLKPGEEL